MADLAQIIVVGVIVAWAAWRVWLRYAPKWGGGKPAPGQKSACGSCGSCKGSSRCFSPGARKLITPSSKP